MSKSYPTGTKQNVNKNDRKLHEEIFAADKYSHGKKKKDLIAFLLSPNSPAHADGYIAAYDNDKQAAYHIYYHATFKLRTCSLHMLIGDCVECLCLAYEQAPLSEFAGFY